MKLYLFSPTHEWDTGTARGVIANSVEDAIKFSGLYAEFTIEEHGLEEGLVIYPVGYDHVDIYAEVEEQCHTE